MEMAAHETEAMRAVEGSEPSCLLPSPWLWLPISYTETRADLEPGKLWPPQRPLTVRDSARLGQSVPSLAGPGSALAQMDPVH